MAFLITLLAGFSTLLGYLFIYLKNDNNRVLIVSLSFASGVMFFISMFDLLPESIKLLCNSFYIFYSLLISSLFLILGIIVSNLMNKHTFNNNTSLYKVGIISMIAIIIHNIPEGIVTYLTSTNNIKLGITLGIAIALHNIPEGISISIPIYYSTNSKLKAFFYTFVSSMSEFIGSIIAFLFLKGFNNSLFLGILYSFTSGIMIYISVYELLPTSLKYHKYLISVTSFIMGIIFIYISIILLG